jgi:hypothetical protein
LLYGVLGVWWAFTAGAQDVVEIPPESPAAAPQATGLVLVQLRVDSGEIGSGGVVRPGDWTGLLATIDNRSGDDLDVLVRWVLRDEDNDIVVAERRAAVNAQRAERVWVYAAVPMSLDGASQPWEVQVVGAADGGLLASQTVRPDVSRLTSPDREMLGIMSVADLGLGDYSRGDTQHAGLALVRGMSLNNLPDRWYGLAGLSKLIWTDDTGGDPADPAIAPAVWPALREWVVRGGHLVIVLPTVGQTWTQSPIADLLPVSGAGLESTQAELLPHPRLSAVRPEDLAQFPMYVFDAQERAGVSVLLRNKADQPIAVSVRRGLGQVTMIGVDLTAPIVRAANIPSGTRRLWNDVFGWMAPVLTQQQVEALTRQTETQDAQMREAHKMRAVPITDGTVSRVTMQGTVALVLLGAVLLFALYLLLSAASYGIVRARNKTHHAWLAFVAVSAGFSVIAWAGAWVARPGKLSAQHVSILDYDGNSPLVKTRSWLSLMVPQFGRAEVKVERDESVTGAFAGRTPAMGAVDPHDTLASPGLELSIADAGFLDPQRYTVDAERPDVLDLPLRATTKRFIVDRLGTHDSAPGKFTQQAPVKLAADFSGPVGTLTHDFPEALQNVIFVYAPGEEYRGADRDIALPWVWRYQQPGSAAASADWKPGEPLELTGVPTNATRLVQRPPLYASPRGWAREGWLGAYIEKLPPDGGFVDVPDFGSDPVRDLMMLSFYGLLPPPEFTQTVSFPGPTRATRPGATTLDLSPLTHSPRLFILALLPDSDLPVPLTVEGDVPESEGLTMVRAVWDLEQ